ncbi:MAG: hypothetical protein H8E91_04985 [Planctomycetes bacterium]|nr:hypothetical protein [Planctomycetota bacterium]
MNILKHMTELYGAAPMFVIFSALFAISELTVMWMVVPVEGSVASTQQDMLMDSFLGENGVVKTSSEVVDVILETQTVSGRLDHDPSSWQQPLVNLNPCQKQTVAHTEVAVVKKPSETWIAHQFLVEIADRAMFELELTSIMKGKSSLANINGSIYQQGDTLLLPNANGAFVVVEVRGDSVLLRLVIDDENILAEFGEIERTLFIFGSTSNTLVDAGERQ